MKQYLRRRLALLLALIMVVSLMPGNMQVRAEETSEYNGISESNIINIPSGKTNLTYNTEEQSLLSTEPITEDGLIKYYVSTSNSSVPTSEQFTLDSATAINAGTYYVYYKIVGDEKHEDKIFETPIAVTIEKAERKNIAVLMSDYTYGGNVSTPSVRGYMYENANSIAFYYNTTNSNEGGIKWDDISEETLDTGNYYMYAIIFEDQNYNEYVTEPDRKSVV